MALLIRRGAVVDAKDRLGRTPLITCANNGGDIEIARMLLAAGSDPRIEDEDGTPALNIAAALGNVKLGEMLLAANADINHKDSGYESPLTAAMFHLRYDFVRMLIRHGVDVNQEERPGHKPLKNFAKDAAMQKLLIDAGAN